MCLSGYLFVLTVFILIRLESVYFPLNRKERVFVPSDRCHCQTAHI